MNIALFGESFRTLGAGLLIVQPTLTDCTILHDGYVAINFDMLKVCYFKLSLSKSVSKELLLLNLLMKFLDIYFFVFKI